VQRAIALATESILADAARKQLEQSIAIPQAQLLEAYQKRGAEFEQSHIRRLVIRTENSLLSASSAPTRPPLAPQEARKKIEELRQQIVDGSSFAELARAHSDDGSSAQNGGDMGFIRRMDVIPPIAQAAFSLAPGQVSEVIPTPYGLELIQVVERRVAPLEEVKGSLEASLRQAQVEASLQQLQEQYKIFVDEAFFRPSGQPPAAGTAPPSR
jgi:hypothetical protein